MAKVKDGDTIRIHYTGTLEDGRQFDSSLEREPLEFTMGAGNIIPGFEKGVMGMEPGDTKKIKIPCEEAYGVRNDEMVFNIEISSLPDDLEPNIGEHLEITQESGATEVCTIIEISEDSITLDANHPLAGQDLKFELELVEIVKSAE